VGTEREHDRIIAAAARDVLGPLGFRRKGRSRLWFADFGWWLILVEFQPSGWSRGAYLNIAAKWLWSPSGSWSFDFAFHPAARVGSFIEFQSEEQFRTASRDQAAAAAGEARRLLEALPNISAAAELLMQRASDHGDGWNAYHAGVAAYLVGRTTDAQRFFSQLSKPRPDDHPSAEWLSELRETAGRFAALTGEGERLREVLSEFVKQSRMSLRLPETNEQLPRAFDAA
jgi:hypothetical protein